MTKQVNLGKSAIIVGYSRSSVGLGFNISKYGIDITLLMLWISFEF